MLFILTAIYLIVPFHFEFWMAVIVLLERVQGKYLVADIKFCLIVESP